MKGQIIFESSTQDENTQMPSPVRIDVELLRDDEQGNVNKLVKMFQLHPGIPEHLPKEYTRSLPVTTTTNEPIGNFLCESFTDCDRQNPSSVTMTIDDGTPFTRQLQHSFVNGMEYQEANHTGVVLQLKWVINALLKHYAIHKVSNKSKDWEQFTRTGQLSDNLLDGLLLEKNANLITKEGLIRFMEYHDIIVKPLKLADITELEDNGKGEVTFQCALPKPSPRDKSMWRVSINSKETGRKEDYYLMPSMLPTRPSSEEIKDMLPMNGTSSPALCMYIKGATHHLSGFHRIMTTCIKDMPVVEHNEKRVLFNSFGAFKIDSATILTTWSWDNMIYVKVTSYHDDKQFHMEAADLQDVRMYFEKLVMHAFNTNVSGNGEKIEISHYITCPKCPEHFPFDRETDDEGFPIDQKSGLLLVENMRIVDNAICNPNQHHVDASKALKNWFGDDTKIKVDSHLIESAFDERFLADLSEEIDIDKHYILASKLNISDRELQRIRNNHETFVSNVTFHILYEWKKRHESLAILLSAVKAAGCREEAFYRILDGTDNDQTKQTLNGITQKLNTNKLEEIELGEDECLTIANCIGLEYWLLGIRLGVPETDIQHMHISKGLDTKKIVHDILLKWRRQPKGQTNREINEELIRAMVKSHCDMSCVIEIFGRNFH